MVLAVAMLPQTLATMPLKIDRGGIEEHEIHLAEEIPALIEESLFDPVFHASGATQCGRLRFDGFAQERHGAIQVMEIEFVGAGDTVLFTPTFGGAVATRCKESMEHSQIDGALDGKVEPTPLELMLQNALNTRLIPEPGEDKIVSFRQACGSGG